MAKQFWHCEKCGTPFKTKEQAERCENNHIGVLDIKSFSFNESSLKNSFVEPIPYPSRIIVEFEDRQFATYTRHYIGPQDIRK